MLILPALVEASRSRWSRRSSHTPDQLAKKIGEGSRRAQTTVEQKNRRFASLLAQTQSQIAAKSALERILAGNDLVGINYLELGTRAARSVCRIHLRNANGATIGFGTGFLVGKGVLMTNHHVLSLASQVQFATAEFDYEYDWQGGDRQVSVFKLQADKDFIANKELDFALVGVEETSAGGGRRLSEYGWLPLNPTPGKAFVGEYLTIIQHPGGERKQVCVRENKLLKFDENGNTIWYMTDTVAGSSGSPVFNGSWQVVALHHSGIPKTDSQGRWLTIDGRVWDSSMDESTVAWEANEAVRMSPIIKFLKARYSNNRLAQAVFDGVHGPAGGELNQTKGSLPGSSSLVTEDGELRMTIPVEIKVRIGDSRAPLPSQSTPSVESPTTPAPQTESPQSIEAVSVSQSDYDKRTGYRPDFLGSRLLVPLPTPKDGTIVLKWKQGTKSLSELKYWNYSVVMHATRRLALFSAVNVDSNLRPSQGGRDGDKWYFDTRIPAKAQLGPEFYASQSEFEANRDQNPFDRGHLTRRLDAQWGKTEGETKRNGDDSFHWTNCSPQHWQFNQGAKRWLGLEDYVIKGFASKTGKACVINGPIFDAPRSTLGPGNRPIPNLKGRSEKDPKFGGVGIPKLFFKIVACEAGNGKLAVASFLMSQEDLLKSVDRLKGFESLATDEILTEAEARLYQVSLADLARLTNLDFGALAGADRLRVHESIIGIQEIGSIKEIDLAAWESIVKITENETFDRTSAMLKREWLLAEEPQSNVQLRPVPPAGLGKSDNQIRALETPIEARDFRDVEARVTGAGLVKAKTVGALSDVIWAGIPDAHKA